MAEIEPGAFSKTSARPLAGILKNGTSGEMRIDPIQEIRAVLSSTKTVNRASA
jgi:hypothetical protein